MGAPSHLAMTQHREWGWPYKPPHGTRPPAPMGLWLVQRAPTVLWETPNAAGTGTVPGQGHLWLLPGPGRLMEKLRVSHIWVTTICTPRKDQRPEDGATMGAMGCP